MPVPSTVEAPADSAVGRLWQSGRLAVLSAGVLLVASMFLPLLFVQRTDHLGPRVSKSPYEMITSEAPYGRELRSTTLLAVPGAAVALASFLASRRTRSVMLASRPLVLVVSLLPLLAAVFVVLRLGRHARFEHAYGPGFAFIVIAGVMGCVGATQFGRGVSDPPRRHNRLDDDGD